MRLELGTKWTKRSRQMFANGVVDRTSRFDMTPRWRPFLNVTKNKELSNISCHKIQKSFGRCPVHFLRFKQRVLLTVVQNIRHKELPSTIGSGNRFRFDFRSECIRFYAKLSVSETIYSEARD